MGPGSIFSHCIVRHVQCAWGLKHASLKFSKPKVPNVFFFCEQGRCISVKAAQPRDQHVVCIEGVAFFKQSGVSPAGSGQGSINASCDDKDESCSKSLHLKPRDPKIVSDGCKLELCCGFVRREKPSHKHTQVTRLCFAVCPTCHPNTAAEPSHARVCVHILKCLGS